MSGMQHIQAGILRTGSEPMQVVSGPMGKMRVHYEAPSSDKLHEEITKFLEWLQTGKDPAPLKAALAHLWFVTLHPFDDGNGRISRTIADYVLAEMDSGSGRFYSMSAEINREKKSYYEILERTQKGGLEVTEWMLWFLECLARALRQALDSLQIAMQKQPIGSTSGVNKSMNGSRTCSIDCGMDSMEISPALNGQ